MCLCAEIDGELRDGSSWERRLIIAASFSFANLFAIGFHDEDDAFKLSLKLGTGQETIFGIGSVCQEGGKTLVAIFNWNFNVGTDTSLVIGESDTDLARHVEKAGLYARDRFGLTD